jgi:isoquinoline 1-oxidoreductase beta subunit
MMLAIRLSSVAAAVESTALAVEEFEPNAFVRIDPNGFITCIIPNTEVGQGIYTSSAMLIGEELEVGLDQIHVQAAPPDLSKYMNPILFDQATGGSTSTRGDWVRLREAGAAARIMLVGAAAKRWKVAPTDCRVERGVIYHDASARKLGYGAVASEAAAQPIPKNIKLKDPAQFKLIGTSAKRIDTPSKVNGTAIFGIDTKVPRMKIGTLAITPVKGGKIARMDEAAARRVPGVRDIVRAGDEAVAVIGDHMWAAKRGLEALNIAWDSGPNGEVTSKSLVDAMERDSQKPGVIARRDGDAQRSIDEAPIKLSAVYRSPYLSHSPLEPLNCTLHIQADRAEIWVGTQVQVRAQKAVADATGLPLEKVRVNNMLMGGAFGRKLEIDSIAIAAALAKQVSYPVKLVWTREQDMTHDYYRPYYYDRVAAGLDASGKLVGRTHRVTGPSLYARWAPAAFKGGLDIDAVDCAADTPYAESAVLAEYVRHEPRGVNTSWWRGVGPTHNVFVVESFVDEMAAAAKKDPVEFRRSMLQKNPRALAVLNLAAEKGDWGRKLPAGQGRGVSLQFAFNSYVACVLDIEVDAGGKIRLRRAVTAVDCGLSVNPDTVRAQMEGGIIFGLSTAMFNEITLTGGAVDQTNFDRYRVLRINEAPRIEVYHIRNKEEPGGVGEAGTSIVAAALGNAIFAATGHRLRQLPLANTPIKPATAPA